MVIISRKAVFMSYEIDGTFFGASVIPLKSFFLPLIDISRSVKNYDRSYIIPKRHFNQYIELEINILVHNESQSLFSFFTLLIVEISTEIGGKSKLSKPHLIGVLSPNSQRHRALFKSSHYVTLNTTSRSNHYVYDKFSHEAKTSFCCAL